MALMGFRTNQSLPYQPEPIFKYDDNVLMKEILYDVNKFNYEQRHLIDVLKITFFFICPNYIDNKSVFLLYFYFIFKNYIKLKSELF